MITEKNSSKVSADCSHRIPTSKPQAAEATRYAKKEATKIVRLAILQC